ncbi:LIM/homeobox protein Awh-like [Haliotis rubra]|uniref:LIM/homeobox protein Awh-like n=1 Tax=Haliotis rubra TaxID=36100 RepID=UPI001EE5D1EF|nr:LIM/homeobox protein Awh-like [Haliotis rubra]
MSDTDIELLTPSPFNRYCEYGFREDSMDSLPSTSDTSSNALSCFRCGGDIVDHIYLRVRGHAWHVQCLQCCVCLTSLAEQTSCFIDNDDVYCRDDYVRECAASCEKCHEPVMPDDWVRRSHGCVYHMECLSCDLCQHQFATGEEFLIHGNKLKCKTHIRELFNGNVGGVKVVSSPFNGTSSPGDIDGDKSKRPRTVFTEEQTALLTKLFQENNSPSTKELENIAILAGLSKKVTQVWFQNARAKKKKTMYKHSLKLAEL